MWPMLLDMSKRECKVELRKLELDAYSIVVSTFRAQGNLNQSKIQILKELETVLKISSDRSKAEMRRACNDEKLYTIAKKLSRGECVTSEWLIQSKRLIPLLPRLQQTNTSSSYYRILADHILQNSKPILKLYSKPYETMKSNEPVSVNIKKEPDEENIAKEIKLDEAKVEPKKMSQRLIKKKIKQEENINNTTSTTINPNEDAKSIEKENNEIIEESNNLFYLANGYAVSANFVQVKSNKPSEFVKEYETSENEDNSFLKNLIQKYKKQKEEKQNLEQLFQQKQQQQITSKETESVKKEVESSSIATTTISKANTKNSKLISQMIEANNTINKKSDLDISNKQQPKPITSISSTPPVNKMPAQIIRLDTSSAISYNSSINTTNTQMNTNASTIVKLTPSNLTPQTSILNGTNNLVHTNSSFGQLLNLNNQNLKHFVLPKTNQKLIILPSSTSSTNPTNLNTTTLKKNFIISSNNSTTSNNSSIKIISQENSEKTNGNVRIIQNGHAHSSPLPKVILYKPNQQSSIIKLTNDTLFNEKIESPVSSNGDKDEQDENNQDSETNQLKRKLSIDLDKVNKHKIIKIEETSTGNSTNTNTPPEWYENNLQLVNQMLDKLNNHDNLNKQKDLKLLCESVKDKLEKNAYECLDDLNQDLKYINSTDKLIFTNLNETTNSDQIQMIN